jgi:hypothetical protein
MGKFGESLVREVHRARGLEVFNLNVGEHGIDGLMRATGSDGRVAFRVIEIKTLQHGTDFRLGQSGAGRQLSAKWIEDGLARAARLHGEAEAQKAARQALEHFRKAPASVPCELHGVSVGDNRYVVKLVDPATGAFKGEAVNCKVTGVLEELAQKARGKEVRQAAARHLAEYKRLQAAVKPRVVQGARFARELAEAAGVVHQGTGHRGHDRRPRTAAGVGRPGGLRPDRRRARLGGHLGGRDGPAGRHSGSRRGDLPQGQDGRWGQAGRRRCGRRGWLDLGRRAVGLGPPPLVVRLTASDDPGSPFSWRWLRAAIWEDAFPDCNLEADWTPARIAWMLDS